ncbi:hypothetical protein PanWU01x14_080510, partial [Parasponia andersonii]
YKNLSFSVESDCATCSTATVLKNCIKHPYFFFSTEVLPKPPKETVHPSIHCPPPCQMRPSAVTGRSQRTSAGCCYREPSPVARKFCHQNGFSPAVPPSDVRSPCHHHRWIRLDSSFDFRPLSAYNSAPVRSWLLVKILNILIIKYLKLSESMVEMERGVTTAVKKTTNNSPSK